MTYKKLTNIKEKKRIYYQNLPAVKFNRSVKNPTVAVVGLGYVGLPLAMLLEEKEYKVIGLDVDEKKLSQLKNKEHIDCLSEKENNQLIQTEIETASDASVLMRADTVIVCVPTPVLADHEPDLAPLKSACLMVGNNVSPGTLVVIESTINPGVCDEVIIPILEQCSGLKVGKDIFLAHCPERINPGDTKWDVSTIPRVVGANDTESLKRATKLYNSLIGTPVAELDSIKEAEAVKIVENSFRDINIAFVNELAISFDRIGIDVVKVINAAATKPFAFMPHFPGCGVGGHCIPVDPYYLISYAARNGFSHRFLSLAREINNNMPIYSVDVLEAMFHSAGKSLIGADVTILGLAYKKNISDMRESPAHMIKEELLIRGVAVRTYDPHVREYSSAKSLDEALRGVDTVMIATDHDEFRSISPEVFKSYGIKNIIDGRNCLVKEKFIELGINYKGIGR